MTKEVQLTRGYVALVDDEEYRAVSMHSWHVKVYVRKDGSKLVYAETSVKVGFKKWTTKRMHRMVLNAAPETIIDHIDGEGLNNQKSNLRFATQFENTRNARAKTSILRMAVTSNFKGVHYDVERFAWVSRIRLRGRSKFLGRFATEVEAAQAYDSAAKEIFGEFARPNFPGTQPTR
jgi:hypothetical protein